MLIIQTTDFVKFFALAANPDDTLLLQDYITRYERKYILMLLGKEMGVAFIADLANGVPQNADFVTIFNQLDAMDDEESLRFSSGIKDILLACVYMEYIKDIQTRNGQAGSVSTNIDAASKASYITAYRIGEKKWNEALNWIETIQWYCLDNPSTYPTFKGQVFHPRYSALL